MGFATRYLTKRVPPLLRHFAGTTALFLIIDEVWTVFRERSKEGMRGFINLPLRFLKYFACTLIVFALFGRNAFVALSLFAWFRRVDDVVDGDMPLPERWNVHQYRCQKSALLSAVARGAKGDLLVEDILLVKGVETARHQGMIVLDEIADIWDVMEWGCTRQETGHVASRSELLFQTAKQDRAVLRIMVKACRGNIERFDEIASGFTGSFTRADWLDDILEDIQRSVINVPREAISEYHVDIAQVLLCRNWDELMQYSPFASWYRDEVRQSRDEWCEMRTRLGEDFAGIFSSRIVSTGFMRITVGKIEPQFERAAARSAELSAPS